MTLCPKCDSDNTTIVGRDIFCRDCLKWFISLPEPDFDNRGPDRDEWKHQAAQWQRLK